MLRFDNVVLNDYVKVDFSVVKVDFQLKFKISALLSGRLHLMWERLTQVTSLLDHGLDLQHL